MPFLSVLLAASVASTRLAALEAELTRTTAAAKARDGQEAWLKSREECAGDAGCLEAAYLARIAALRLANGELFARAQPPSGILGRYSEKQEICDRPKEGDDEYKCEATVENYIRIERGRGNALVVDSEIFFMNGHECTVENAPAEWVSDELRVSVEEDCVLLLRFDSDGVHTSDPGGRCKDLRCGANASFYDLTIPKKTRKR